MKILIILLSFCAMANMAYADDGTQLGTYVHGNYVFNVRSIPDWQTKIYTKIGIPWETRLMMRTMNQLECGDENGFCLGLNKADAGPFQINQIHKTDYRYSARLVERGRDQVEEAKVSKNWSGVISTRDELFEFQVRWTWERMKRLAIQYEAKTNYSSLSREKQVWLQAVWHNGNTKRKNGREFRFWYADKAVKHYRILVGNNVKAAVEPEKIPILNKTEDVPVFPELALTEAEAIPPALEEFYLPTL